MQFIYIYIAEVPVVPEYSYAWAEVPVCEYARAEVYMVPVYSCVRAEVPAYSLARAEVPVVVMYQ